MAPNGKNLVGAIGANCQLREKTDHRQLAPTGANWRKFAKFANGAISAKLAKIKVRNRVYTYLRIANWRCRQLAPKVGAISDTLAPIGAISAIYWL